MAFANQQSGEASSHRKKLYRSARWQARRKAQLEEHPLCIECLNLTPSEVVAATVVDHVTPHRGDEELFYEGEVQSLCATHHSKHKQQEEVRGYSPAIGADGWPVDAAHPFNSGADTNVRRSGQMSHPMWFRKSFIPLTIVCGPPGSGKSTWVKERAGPRDLVISFDEIAVRLKGSTQEQGRARIRLTSSEIGDVLRARNEMLSDLMRASARERWEAAYLIVSEPRAERRQWWQATLQPKEIVVLPVPADECKARCARDRAAGDPRAADVDAAIDRWWAQYRLG